MKKMTLVLATLLVASPALAVVPEICEDYIFDNLGLAIPDGSDVGVSNAQTIAGSAITSINDVNVDLFISGTWNGDLRVVLSHESGTAVLLNRVGVRGGTNPAPPGGGSSSFGYADDGVDIILDDEADNDVHYYRFSLFGDHNAALPAGSPLGSDPNQALWQPDARLLDIGVGSATAAEQQAMVAEPRVALLSVFDGMDANGVWTLSAYDQASGDTHTLQRWSLHICGVPEPASIALLGLAGLLIRRR